MNLKKTGAKLSIVVIGSILATMLCALVGNFLGINRITKTILQEDVTIAAQAFTNSVEEMQSKSKLYVQEIANAGIVRRTVADGGKARILVAINTILQEVRSDNNFTTVTDANGTVLLRSSSPEVGDSIADRPSIVQALAGNTVSTIVPSSEKEALSIQATSPVYNTSNKIIGTVTVGYWLDQHAFMDGLKRDTGAEMTIFENGVAYNTSLMADEARYKGYPLPDSVSKAVLERGESVFGEENIAGQRLFSVYQPFLDSEGNTIGVLFAGKNVEVVQAAKMQTIAIIAIIILIMAIAASFISFGISKRIVVNPVVKMSVLAKELSQGNLNAQTVEYKAKDEIGELAASLGDTVHTLKLYIQDITQQLDKMADGDMTATITQEYLGDFAPIKVSMMRILDSMNHTLSAIHVSSEQVNTGAEQVSSGAQALSEGATEQASAIQQLSASIAEVSGEVGRNAENVKQATGLVSDAVAGVSQSDQQMTEMLSAMQKIDTSSKEIGKIIKVIDDIAFQTNILALNAAVEAARAGAAGKGFAVVADEVRNLASKSADAANHSTGLIEESIRAVVEGSKIAQNTAKALTSVTEKTNQVQQIILKIDEASMAQAQAIRQITQGVDQISAVVQNNSATAEQSSAASEELSAQAHMLREEVNKFTLRKMGAEPAPFEEAEAPAISGEDKYEKIGDLEYMSL